MLLVKQGKWSKMELVSVEYYDDSFKVWRKANVSTKSDVIKALDGKPGDHFDLLRSKYRYLGNQPSQRK
jgi:hypothetical protein